MTSTIEFYCEDRIGYIAINRPNKLNALDPATLEELCNLLQQSERFAKLWGCLLVTAGDRAFVAGADISVQATLSANEAQEFGRLGQRAANLLENLPLPVIACVDGFALGGGCELAMACDFIYATQNAVFGQPEVTLGLIPGFGGCWRLPQYVGFAKARELIYSGRKISATEAYNLGLVNQVFLDREQLLSAAKSYLQSLQNVSGHAVSLCKKTLNECANPNQRHVLDFENQMFMAAFNHQDSKEGTKAFLNKSTPQFRGQS